MRAVTEEPTASPATADSAITAARLNRECFCITLDEAALGSSLRADLGGADVAALMAARPHLFSRTPVFLPGSEAAAMQAIVAAIEAAAELPQYQDAALAWAPEIAAQSFGPRGAFMGYDFHLGAAGPKLIEVNTNAGGAFLNAVLGRAQIACCAELERGLADGTLDAFDAAVVSMFEAEWRSQRGDAPLRRIAIVDDAPEAQYLYPELVLAKALLERRGYEALVADAASLRYEDGSLHADGRPIDLIYNRLVDFALAAPEHAALRTAYRDGAVVLTPGPRHHALYADKRNLTLLSDQAALRAWGLPEAHVQALAGLPHAVRVKDCDAEDLWANRKRWFFKPASGYASKAVYRGDKLTKSVWESILSGDYIAQELAPPGERTIMLGDERVARKVDVRLYTYAGQAILSAARVYQGQTTNFRTPGGGFAPVFFV
jgi:hypothetical protein